MVVQREKVGRLHLILAGHLPDNQLRITLHDKPREPKRARLGEAVDKPAVFGLIVRGARAHEARALPDRLASRVDQQCAGSARSRVWVCTTIEKKLGG